MLDCEDDQSNIPMSSMALIHYPNLNHIQLNFLHLGLNIDYFQIFTRKYPSKQLNIGYGLTSLTKGQSVHMYFLIEDLLALNLFYLLFAVTLTV